jgi:hypothetical protein
MLNADVRGEERQDSTGPGPKPAPPPPRHPGESAGGERDVQQSGYIWLGAILLVAFFLPLYARHVLMPNVLILTEKGGPAALKFLAVYPVLAGLATLALARTAKGTSRSLLIMAMGLLVLVLFYVSPQVRREVGGAPGSPLSLGGIIILLGMIGTFAGSRARSFRPASGLAAGVSTVGAVLYLLALVLPTQPKEVGLVPLAGPFIVMFGKQFGDTLPRIAIGLINLAGMGMMIGASVLCLLNATARADAAARAQTAFRLWIWSLVALIVASLVPLVQAASGGEMSARESLSELLFMVKMDLHVLGFFFLILLGAAGLVVDLSREQAA